MTAPEPQTLAEYLEVNTCKGFTPGARYNPRGGWLDVYWKDERCRVRDINAGFALFLSMETGEPVGVRVYGARELTQEK